MGFGEIVHQYSEVLIVIAVVLVIIGAIVILGQTGYLETIFKTVMDAFTTKAQSQAGL